MMKSRNTISYLSIILRHELPLNFGQPNFKIFNIAVEWLLITCILKFGAFSDINIKDIIRQVSLSCKFKIVKAKCKQNVTLMV